MKKLVLAIMCMALLAGCGYFSSMSAEVTEDNVAVEVTK